jgi:hypothetical protein
MPAAYHLGFWVMTIFSQYWRKAYTNESMSKALQKKGQHSTDLNGDVLSMMAVAVMAMIGILHLVIFQITFVCDWSFITQYF